MPKRLCGRAAHSKPLPFQGERATTSVEPAAWLERRIQGLQRRSKPVLGLALLSATLLVSGCQQSGRLLGQGPAALPLPEGIEVVFNQREDQSYRSPISGQWRRGDDLEALVLSSIAGARREILVAVQELSLPAIARALVRKQHQGSR